jgi:hypothetical protein
VVGRGRGLTRFMTEVKVALHCMPMAARNWEVDIKMYLTRYKYLTNKKILLPINKNPIHEFITL